MLQRIIPAVCRCFHPPETFLGSSFFWLFGAQCRWESSMPHRSSGHRAITSPEHGPRFSKVQVSDASSSDKSSNLDLFIDFRSPEHRDRVNRLAQFFTKTDIEALAAVCPKAFFQDWSEVENIVNYISTKMGLNQEDMVDAKVFNYSLEHVVKRHIFVERCGMFRKVNVKKREAELATMMSLNAIVRSPNSQFVRFVGVTDEEYDVYCDMFSMQRHKLLDYIGDSKLPLALDDEITAEIEEEEEENQKPQGYYRERKKRAKERGISLRE